jgi:hypothetical protein
MRGPKQHEIVGFAVAVAGYEEDYLLVVPPDADLQRAGPQAQLYGICRLIRETLGEEFVIAWITATAFATAPEDRQSGGWQQDIDDYRTTTKRDFPPLMRLRIAVTAEPASDAETRAYWESHYQPRGA